MDDSDDPLLGIEHHIDSYVVEAWRSSYTVEVWKGSYIVEAWTIVLIHCLVSITIMIPRTRKDKFLHRGSVERVLYCGSMDECTDLLLEKFLHRGSVEKDLYRGSMDDCANPLWGIEHHNVIDVVEAWRSSYAVEVWKRVLYCGSMDDCANPFLVLVAIITRTAGEEKFLDRGYLERVLYCGSMDNYADPLLGIEHHNDTYSVKAWRCSYTVEVWKGSYIVEAWMIVLIRY
nr:hypothetical protein CFP56_19870 [Quercus suber]